MATNTTDVVIVVVGGAQGVATAGQGISILSASGQAIAGIVSVVAPIGGAIAVNPAAGLITLIRIGIDANANNQVNIGDAISVVGNSLSVAAAICLVVPGGQPVALGLAAIGRAMTIAGIGLSLADVNYPLSPRSPRIDPATNRNFQDAQNWVAPRDPLILDLDNDGIEAVGINPSAPILFDMDGDGIKTATGWIKADDGMLVLDRNGNGLIDSGRELFGDATILTRGPRAGQNAANGYEALADLDINGDGVINSLDAAYASLRIWQDANQDGISQASELRTLSSLGIASLNVTGQASNVNLGNGNTQPFSGSFTRTNGSTGASGVAEVSGSLLLAGNNFYREFTDNPAITAAAAVLPQMQGSGWVRDLRAAGSLSGGCGRWHAHSGNCMVKHHLKLQRCYPHSHSKRRHQFFLQKQGVVFK